jgi:hypothetical protein
MRGNTGRKSKFSESDRRKLKRTVSKNHTTTAAKVTAELNIHPADSVSTQKVRRELHKSNIPGTAAIAKPLSTENNAKIRKR